MEIEVFRLMEPSSRRDLPNYPEDKFFSVDKCYEFAYKTSTSGRWPNARHFTTNPMQYVGRYVRSNRWGYGDNGGGAEVFNNNGTEVTITLDYAGTASFREVPCREGGGGATNSSASAAVPSSSASTVVKPTKPTIKDEDACVICLENEKTHAFTQCGHMCVCETCGLKIMRTTRSCPICRSNSSSVLHIYRSKYLKYKQKYLKLKNEMK